jgi:hypothetical protein
MPRTTLMKLWGFWIKRGATRRFVARPPETRTARRTARLVAALRAVTAGDRFPATSGLAGRSVAGDIGAFHYLMLVTGRDCAKVEDHFMSQLAQQPTHLRRMCSGFQRHSAARHGFERPSDANRHRSNPQNNWQDINSCIGTPQEVLSTRCGGQGVVVFKGLAKPELARRPDAVR